MKNNELEKLILHFKNMYHEHQGGSCDFYDECLYCAWDKEEEANKFVDELIEIIPDNQQEGD